MKKKWIILNVTVALVFIFYYWNSEQTKLQLREEIEQRPLLIESGFQEFITSIFENHIIEVISEQYNIEEGDPVGFGIRSDDIEINESRAEQYTITFYIRVNNGEKILGNDILKYHVTTHDKLSIQNVKYVEDGWESDSFGKRIKE